MASHHHHHCQAAPTAITSTACYCCHCCTNFTSSHHPPPPEPHLLHHYPPPQPPYFYAPHTNPPYSVQGLHQPHPHQQPQYHSPSTGFEKECYFQDQQEGLSYSHPIVSSLLRRIAALESSLRRHSSPHSHSLRDAAARTIQTHFRAFLVRRSRTLRQLKHLASVKSTLNFLKSSVSDHNSHLDPQALLEEALDLLLKLDSIQGDDPMIRDGKRSINRELSRFICLIDGATVKRSQLRSIKKNAGHGVAAKKSVDLLNHRQVGNDFNHDLGRDKVLEDLGKRIDALCNKVRREDHEEEDDDLESPSISVMIAKNGVSQTRHGALRKKNDSDESKLKKSVTFAENGNAHKFPRSRHQPNLVQDFDCSDGIDSISAKCKLGSELRRDAEEVRGISFKDTEDDDEEAQSDDALSTRSSDDGGRGRTLSAPLPVTMETISDLMEKRKTLKPVE